MTAADPAGDRAYARIAQAGGARVAPPTLLPARTILDLSGEAVRARLCAFTDASGEEFAMRPDMTTPIAVMAAKGEIALQRHHYSGSVYRLSQPGTDDPIEFRQVGFEWFGGGGLNEDAEALALTMEAVSAAGPQSSAGGDWLLRVGDVGLYHAVVDALPFSPRWNERLKRAFARRKGPRQLLEDASAGGREGSVLGASLAALPAEAARQAVEEIFAMAGVQAAGGRSAAEIAERLRDVAADEAPSGEAVGVLSGYLDLNGSAPTAMERLRGFAKENGLKIDAALDAFGARVAEIARLAPPFWGEARFSAEAGQRFEYYDGFVFDLGPVDAPARPVAAGGRYDGLIGKLSSGERRSPAIGAALRAARLGGEGEARS